MQPEKPCSKSLCHFQRKVMNIRPGVLVIASLVSLATSQSKTPVRPLVSMAIVDGRDSDMGEKDSTS